MLVRITDPRDFCVFEKEVRSSKIYKSFAAKRLEEDDVIVQMQRDQQWKSKARLHNISATYSTRTSPPFSLR